MVLDFFYFLYSLKNKQRKAMNLKNKQKGFTLVELILIVGIISIMTIGLYIKYRSVNNAQKIEMQMQDLYAISNNITKGFQSQTSLGTFNNTTAIIKGLIPVEISNSPIISSKFGTTLTLSDKLVAGNPGYEIIINNITPKECSAIATTKFANEVDEIWINGANRKTTGQQLTNANISTIVTQCNTANSVGFRNRVYFSPPTDEYSSNRPNQTNKYYIPTLNANVTSASNTCSMGGTWTGSFCSCPVGQEFNGSACVAHGPLNCAYGEGVRNIGGACEALPPTKASETFFNGTTFVTQAPQHYTSPPTTQAACVTANGYWDRTTNICGGVLPTQTTGAVTAPIPVREGDRYFPQAMNTQVTNLVSDNAVRDSASFCAANGGNWDGKICNYCPSPNGIATTHTRIVNATAGTAIVTNMAANPATVPLSANGHAASSVWNVDRCVTPSAGLMGPTYPQVVTW